MWEEKYWSFNSSPWFFWLPPWFYSIFPSHFLSPCHSMVIIMWHEQKKESLEEATKHTMAWHVGYSWRTRASECRNRCLLMFTDPYFWNILIFKPRRKEGIELELGLNSIHISLSPLPILLHFSFSTSLFLASFVTGPEVSKRDGNSVGTHGDLNLNQ